MGANYAMIWCIFSKFEPLKSILLYLKNLLGQLFLSKNGLNFDIFYDQKYFYNIKMKV